ncbi:CesT family type III secretion system chaperone [Pseudomonas cichorii]|uniref:type III secretion system chaperone n=1 Tax=Pseudomonas TaxID=286 RepID=UPI000BA3AD5D|nr:MULTISPECIES: type III secretion system chaperone [Pseudomonas]MBX8510905.1 CesT family type III secretion system chaperone [Pseudomonas cichorii]MBX8525738.1 CesT family type III secretion system chaperone [Pseudomonas cichorii]
MKSADLTVAVERWLDSNEPVLLLQVDQQPLSIKRSNAGLIYLAPLSAAWRGGDDGLEAALRLSGPSIRRFRGALALDPETSHLCLVQYQKFQSTALVIHDIEELVNQRDVWESMLEPRKVTPPRQFMRPMALRGSYV